MAFVNNYSTSFRYLDFIFGTDDKYRAHKAKLQKAREAAQNKGASKEEQAALVRKLFEETEKEGVIAEQKAEQSSRW